MIEIFVVGNQQYVENALGDLSDEADLVMMRAANSTISNVTKNIKAEVTKRYRVKSTDVGKSITVKKAYRSKPLARVISKDVHFNLAQFHVNPMGRLKIGKGGKRKPKVYKAAVMKPGHISPLSGSGRRLPFVATVKKNGFTGLFRRKRGIEGEAGYLEGVYGPAIPQMLKNKEVMKVISVEASDMMTKRMKHEINTIVYNSLFS